MANCKNCGTQLPDGANVCPNCGVAVTPPVNEAQQKAEELLNTPDFTVDFSSADIEENKGIAILSYLNILFIVPLLVKPESPFVKFHVNQGLLTFIIFVLFGILGAIPLIGWIISGVGELMYAILIIIGIINAANGKAKELPIIGKIRIIK